MSLYLGNTKINSLQAEYAVTSGVSSVNGQIGAVVIDDMTGATTEVSGVSGLVPAPAAGDEGKYLKGDGTWAEVDKIFMAKYGETTIEEIVEAYNSGKAIYCVKDDTIASLYYIASTGSVINFAAGNTNLQINAISGWAEGKVIGNMTGPIGSLSGSSGLVPAPSSGDNEKFLRGDGTWGEVASGASGITATLSASGWTEQSDDSYAQTVSVTGVTANNQVVVDVALSGSDIDADIEVLNAWGCVNRASQTVNSLTFYCYGDTPTVSIPLNAVVM